MSEPGSSYLFNMRARGDWVRVRTLVILRWIAVIGQTLAVLLAAKIFGFRLPMENCALVISAAVIVNLISYLVHPAEKRLSERGTLLSLFFDLAQLVGLLMLTGGINNPFAVLILAPVTISATALRLSSTLWLGVAAMAAVPLMSAVHLPLIDAAGEVLEVPELYRIGLSGALVIGVVFLSLYVRRVAVEGYRMSEALSATQIALAREQRLAAIGGIAAAAAHELGTPLATIKLVAGELARELKDQPELAEDVALIRREAVRCGDIMADLSRGGRDDSHVKHAPISAVIEEAARPHSDRGKRIILRWNGLPLEDGVPAADLPSVARRPELVHGLRNLIQNAVDFARTTVWIDIDRSERAFRIAIGDDGPGFSPDVLPRLGEPYVSTRARGSQKKAPDGEYEGMGLGLFIARTLLERTGATLSFANGSDSRRRLRDTSTGVDALHPPGAIFELIWTPSDIIKTKESIRQALGRNQRFGPDL